MKASALTQSNRYTSHAHTPILLPISHPSCSVLHTHAQMFSAIVVAALCGVHVVTAAWITGSIEPKSWTNAVNRKR
jgi:cytochrome b subunit of formate dehydrogenase